MKNFSVFENNSRNGSDITQYFHFNFHIPVKNYENMGAKNYNTF